LAYKLILYSDHKVLKHLHSLDKLSSRHVGWAAYVQQFSFVIKHKFGAVNKVTDTLSRKATLLTTMRTQILGFHLFKNSLSIDPYFGSIVSDMPDGYQDDYAIHDGFLFKGNQLYFPEGSLRSKIIQELHNEGHVRHDKTLKLIADQFYWPTMKKEVAKFLEEARFAKCPRVQPLLTSCTCHFPFWINRGRTPTWTLFWDYQGHNDVMIPSLLWLIGFLRSLILLLVVKLLMR
jgi:hypothetical protein